MISEEMVQKMRRAVEDRFGFVSPQCIGYGCWIIFPPCTNCVEYDKREREKKSEG